MKKSRSIFALFSIVLIGCLTLLSGCGDNYSSDSYEALGEPAADVLSMSVVSSSIIELDWRETETSSAYQLYRKDDGGEEKLVYQGDDNRYEDNGLRNGVMYCYRLKICAEDCAPASDTVCSSTREWKSHGQAPWSVRYNHGSVVFQDKIWVIGGEYFEDTNRTYNDVWTFDGYEWELATAAAPWSARGDHVVVVFKDRMWILGGDEHYGAKVNDIWSSSDGKNWEQILAQAPWPARDHHSSLVFKDKIWIFGGEGLDFNKQRDVWSSSDGKNWEQVLAQAPWPENVHHNFLVFRNQIWMLEGDDEYITDSSRNVWTSSDGRNWQKQVIQGSKHWMSEALVFKDRIWLTGGFYDEEISNEVWLSKDGLNGTRDNHAAWPSRHRHASVAFQNKIWVFGGMASFPDHSEFNDVWSY